MGKMTISVKSKVIFLGDFDLDQTDRELPFRLSDINFPVKNKIYTVREIIRTSRGVGIRLKEVVNQEFFFRNIHRREEPIFDIKKFKLA